jgi:hypothetical protein
VPLTDPDRLALSRAMAEARALQRLTVVAIAPRYAGQSAAAVVHADERHGERLRWTVPWLALAPVTTIADRVLRVLGARQGDAPLLVDPTLLCDASLIGQPGLDTLASMLGQMPVRMPATTDLDLYGAVQSAFAFRRIRLGDRFKDAIEAAVAGLRVEKGEMLGCDDAGLRAVALGVWWTSRALGDSAAHDAAAPTDDRELTLEAERQAREERAWELGL